MPHSTSRVIPPPSSRETEPQGHFCATSQASNHIPGVTSVVPSPAIVHTGEIKQQFSQPWPHPPHHPSQPTPPAPAEPHTSRESTPSSRSQHDDTSPPNPELSSISPGFPPALSSY